ncbi:MAG: 16S rRNA (adenine(1518)-N(6)/adenine(1519)-N(6))-dimethyltransferase RsmA [Alphaproteobacteria bacterium]|nr:16S rRNA (adenine(1518)-N(6)/adenine(1519)-N(6))-dimethyltransferase RsmA [Alphaproteobacteria bacterium]
MDNDLELSISQVIKKYGLLSDKRYSKSLGQNFLTDSTLLDRIARQALPFNGEDIVEIGPGPCGLTRSILHIFPRTNIFCIEKDCHLKELHNNLKAHLGYRLNFIYKDAINVNLKDITKNRVIIIANLPYNVGTQLLVNWLHEIDKIERMVIMLQEEVVDRICAKTGTKDYGRLSIISQLQCNVEKLFVVSKKAFTPSPKVESAIVKLTPKTSRLQNLTKLEKLTSVCFQHRRKTILNILKKYYKNCEEVLTSCAIDFKSRPEVIHPELFDILSQKLITTE